MGTRNITRVISNEQLKVCQYCQWDGYPTGAGQSIINFIRNSDDTEMRNKLQYVHLAKALCGDTFYTGAPTFAEAVAIEHDEFDFRCAANNEFIERHESINIDWYEYVKARKEEMLVEKYGKDLIERWLIASRDTGDRILDIIYNTDHEITLWTEDYFLENKTDWQIEAIWTLNYDTGKLIGNWHGNIRTWTFDELRMMTDDDVREAMEDFENEDEDDD